MGPVMLNRRNVAFSVLGLATLYLFVHLVNVTRESSAAVVVVASEDPEPMDKPELKYGGGKLQMEPPTYAGIRAYEEQLPQHNLDLPFPEGRTGRYVRFSNQQTGGMGLNNVLTDVLLCAHTAYLSGRAYVFQDYTWATHHWPFRIPYYGDEIPRPTTPINAILGGPIAGGPWEENDPTPRSVSSAWFDVVCPESEIFILWTDVAKPPTRGLDAPAVLDHWVKLLKDSPERCIDVRPGPPGFNDNLPQTYDLYLWNSDRALSLFEDFVQESPTSRLLRSSPVVTSAVRRNELLFMPRSPRPPHGKHLPRDPFSRVLAMHIRRGDYLYHCEGLAQNKHKFWSWNRLPQLVDHYDPEEHGWNTTLTMEHCLPDKEQILRKANAVRDDYLRGHEDERVLDVVYLLTNDGGDFIGDVAAALKADKWDTVVTTSQLQLDLEQTSVGMSIDMEIGQQAAVFVGNGFSSYTATILHRRTVEGKDLKTLRFW